MEPNQPDRETQRRLLEKGLVEGLSVDELEAALLRTPGVTRDEVRNDLNRLLALLREEGHRIQRQACDPVALALAVRRRERIYHQAIKSNDRRIALDAEKDRCRLLGAYPADREPATPVAEEHDLDLAIERELERLARRKSQETAEETAAATYPRLARDEPD